MKKVISVFLTMVFMFVVIGMTHAEEIYHGNWNEAYDKVYEWCNENCYYYYSNEDHIGAVGFGYGALNKDSFEWNTGKEWSMENWIEYTKEKFEMSYFDVNKIGDLDGTDVYKVTAVGKDIWESYDKEEEKYKSYDMCSLIFIVCSTKDC